MEMSQHSDETSHYITFCPGFIQTVKTREREGESGITVPESPQLTIKLPFSSTLKKYGSSPQKLDLALTLPAFSNVMKTWLCHCTWGTSNGC